MADSIRTPSAKKHTKRTRKSLTPGYDRSPSQQSVTKEEDPTIQRRLRDLCATIQQSVQAWEQTTQSSFQTLNSLNSLYSQLRACGDEELAKFLPDGSFSKYKAKLLFLRESLFSDLLKAMDKYKELFDKVLKASHSLKVCYYMDLEKMKTRSECEIVSKEDMSCSIDEFCDLVKRSKSFFLYKSSDMIVDCYQSELALKQFIETKTKEAFSSDSDSSSQLSLYTSVWLHQPYLTESIKWVLDGMLIEIGLIAGSIKE